jgi:predicted RNA-binding Zn ribbon-like protein
LGLTAAFASSEEAPEARLHLLPVADDEALESEMIAFSRKRDTAALAVGLVNTWDVMATDRELLKDANDLRRLLRFYAQERLARRVRADDVEPVRALRDQLRAVFEAPSEDAAVELLNAIVRRSGAIAQLVRVRDRWSYRHHAPDASLVDTLATITSVALLDVVRTAGWSRFGLCVAAPCCCVFIDSSRNRSRRYCSDLCADRVSQAAHRRRARSPGA